MWKSVTNKWIFVVLAKIGGYLLACLRLLVIVGSRMLGNKQCKQLSVLQASFWKSFWHCSCRPKNGTGVIVRLVMENNLKDPSLNWVQFLRLLICNACMPNRARIFEYRSDNSLIIIDQISTFEFLKKPETFGCLGRHRGDMIVPLQCIINGWRVGGLA